MGMLEFIYTGDIWEQRRKNVDMFQLISIADMWDVKGLLEWIASTVDEKCVGCALEQAINIDNKEFLENVLDTISKSDRLHQSDFAGVRSKVVVYIMDVLHTGRYNGGMFGRMDTHL